MNPPEPTWLAEVGEDGETWFRIGKISERDEVVAEWLGLARLVARRDGSASHLWIDPDADPRLAEKIRRGSAPLLLRHLEGSLALHGSAVALGDRAVVLLGRSGAGKSTLAAALCSGGASLLADDAVSLDPARGGGDAGWVVVPQEADHWLDSAAREALGITTAVRSSHPRLARDKEPIRAARAGEGAARVIAFVGLRFGGERPSLVPERGVEAVGSLIPQLARFVLDEPERQKRELDLVHRLVESVRCFTLERPRRFEDLAATADLILDLLGRGSTRGVP